MEATTKTSISFIVLSIFVLTTTTTTATFINPLTIPSCIGHPSLQKCAHDIQNAFASMGTTKIVSPKNTVSLMLDSINAAKASYINVLHFCSSNHIESEFVNSLNAAFRIAIHQLTDASKVLHRKTTLSTSELHQFQNFLHIAQQSIAKFSTGLNHKNVGINSSLQLLINQSVNLTALSLKIVGQSCNKISLSAGAIMIN